LMPFIQKRRRMLEYYVADMVFYIEFTVLMRFRKYGLLNEIFSAHPSLLTTVPPISIGIHYYIKMVVYFGEIVISANRLTSAMRPVTYEKVCIWSSTVVWIVRALQFFLPLIVMLPVALNKNFEFKYVIYANQSTLRLETDEVSTGVTIARLVCCEIGTCTRPIHSLLLLCFEIISECMMLF
uniref:G protein-coupled receptor n=1 Tax=Heligmosomoides polygyrus TaxID=6339 RepID=A0A183FNE4_HELPZ